MYTKIIATGATIAVIGIAFFAYQSFTDESTVTDVNAEAAGAQVEVQIEAHQVYVSEDNKIETAKTSTNNKENIISNENTTEKTAK